MSLASRAKALTQVRSFFSDRHILEVDCSQLSPFGSVDAYIDLVEADGGYLHSSPEYAMKKLLANGSGDIYYLGHVYRKEEIGSLHNVEFTMIEYYRIGQTLPFLIDEVIELCHLFVPKSSVTKMGYDEALQKYGQPIEDPHLTEQEKLHLNWATHVEPNFKGLTVITDFPPSEAALSKIIDGKAMRFEIYYNGVELANGYNELNNSAEQRKRLIEANGQREAMGKKAYPMDEAFIKCLDKLPDCVGVAIGFDRLLQIKLKKPSLHDILLP